jgi:hypothetical protein
MWNYEPLRALAGILGPATSELAGCQCLDGEIVMGMPETRPDGTRRWLGLACIAGKIDDRTVQNFIANLTAMMMWRAMVPRRIIELAMPTWADVSRLGEILIMNNLDCSNFGVIVLTAPK